MVDIIISFGYGVDFERCGLHITHICTELYPITEFGRKEDSVLNLSSAMQRRGNLVDVILPKYPTLKFDELQNLGDSEVSSSPQ